MNRTSSRYLGYLSDILNDLSYTLVYTGYPQNLHSPCLHAAVFVTIHVTLVTLYSLKSPFTAVQTGSVNMMTLFVINTIPTLLPAVLTKRIAITLCRKLKIKLLPDTC